MKKYVFFFLIIGLLFIKSFPIKKTASSVLVSPIPKDEMIFLPKHQAVIKETLKFIAIPKINIFLALQMAKIQDDEWKLTNEKTAFFGEGTSFPGNPGITVIFAHAKYGLFALLPLLKKDDTIMVMSNTHIFFYKITENQIVFPDNISLLNSRGTNKLAILTCYGKQDANRIVFFGVLDKVVTISRENNSLYRI